MKITIDVVSNGYVVTTFTDEDKEKLVFQADETVHGDLEAVADLLLCIKEQLGFSGSKHDAKRIYVIQAPGFDHPDWKSFDHAFFDSD